MPRVLLVHGNSEWYGSDRSLVLLATALRELGLGVEVVLPKPGGAAGPLVAAGIPIHYIRSAPLRARVMSRLRLARYVVVDLPLSVLRIRRLARRFDVVHVNTSILLGAIVGGALARRPVVVHVRESYAGGARAWRAYARVVRPFTSAVVAISEDVAAEAHATAIADRVTMIHNGLCFGPAPDARGTGPVLVVGRINEWKGHAVLIDAVALLRSRGLSIPVEVAGDTFSGDEHILRRLHEQALTRGVSDLITFLGYVEDVDGLMRRAGIFVQPSTRPEPFGLSLVDALGHGLACIATNAGGPRDIIANGETGLLVPLGDAPALADALEQLWLDAGLRRRLGSAAAADVRRRFSITSTAMRVSELYNRLLGSPGS